LIYLKVFANFYFIADFFVLLQKIDCCPDEITATNDSNQLPLIDHRQTTLLMALGHLCCLSEARTWGGGARLGEHDLLESHLRRFRLKRLVKAVIKK
jgi:hypothetical protein